MGCGHVREKQKPMTPIKEVGERSGIAFEQDARVLFQEDNLGGQQEAQLWLIHSRNGIILPKGEAGYLENEDARNYWDEFLKHSSRDAVGSLKSPRSTTSFWETANGNWQGTVIQAEGGTYLRLEWGKQK